MIKEILELMLITFIPYLELRASIPYGILKIGMNWWSVWLICVVINILLGILIYLLIDRVVKLFLRIKWFARWYHRWVERAQKKIETAVEKYGWIGVGLFIGVPLPGSGVYTGGLGSYLIGLDFKKFVLACILGCVIAGTAVTLIVLFGQGVFGFLLKNV